MLREVTSTNCNQDKDRLKSMDTLNILSQGKDCPRLKCLPNSMRSLRITGAATLGNFVWPKSLALFKITNMIKGYPTAALAKIGPHVKYFHVSYANVKNGIMPKVIGGQNITFVTLQHCNITWVNEDTFLHNKKLRKLDLTGNSLTNFDVKMPPTLIHLNLHNNKIKMFNSSYLASSHLIYLGLYKNALKTCPTGLPKTLRMLVLNNNEIETCLPETFAGLTALRQLDLSNNRLKIMPSGIESKLEIYRIGYNSLSRIHGPENYKFCNECSYLDISNNQWFCDLNFFKFILWSNSMKGVNINRDFFLTFGRCSDLPKYAFGPEYLQEVVDYTKHITSPPYQTCRYEPQRLLNCTRANITRFPNSPPRGLKNVIITRNPGLTEVPDFVFTDQSRLRSIELQRNNLKRIPFGLPSSVIYLNLQENNITELSPKDREAFSNLSKLESLILHDNHIKTLFSQDFQALKNLKWIGLERNDLVCDCSLYPFIIWYRRLNSQYKADNPLIRFARCKSPKQLQHRDIRKLYYYYDYNLQCISPLCEWNEKTLAPTLNCSIHSQQGSDRMALHVLSGPIYGKFPQILAKRYWKELFLDGLRLNDHDVNLTQFTQLIHIDLSNNLLTKWSPQKLPMSLRKLNLRGNNIHIIPHIDVIMKYQQHLESVDMRDNKIKIITPQQTATLMSLEEFYLQGNPFDCNCSIGAFNLWLKFNATANQHRNDGKDLTCSAPKDLSDQKLVSLVDEDYCKKPVSIDSRIWVAVGILIIVISLAMIALVQVIRKRRYRKEILTGFQRILQEDASHNRSLQEKRKSIPAITEEYPYVYDAFVATEECDYDGNFVEKLIEELEQKRNFKLCISTRDFMPGMDVSDSITESITSSKRVIIIISKRFIASPWCQYKVQVALAELHKRQKKLLIPITLEDLPHSSSSSINTFISLIPTSRAPRLESSKRNQDKFWNNISDAIKF